MCIRDRYNKSVAGERYRAVGKAMGVMGIDEMNDVEAADATIAALQQDVYKRQTPRRAWVAPVPVP